MMTSKILVAAVAVAAIVAPAQAQLSIYTIINQVSNAGFENGMTSWSTNQSYIDPNWTGDPADFDPLFGQGTTSTRRSGLKGYQFGLEYNLGGVYAYSEVHQTLVNPVNTNSLSSAQLYAWSTASKWSPQTLTVTVVYSDASPSYYSQDITGSYYSPQPSDWQLVDFKSSLKAGKTITGIMISSESFPYNHNNLFMDDFMLGKRVPLIVKI